jgi:tRNA pseudouridine(38-40) synthase
MYRKHQSTSTPVEHSLDQNPLPSVQGTLVDVLDPVFGRLIGKHTTTFASSNIERDQNTLPVEIKVSGRTDAGVSAIGQICRLRTWRTDLPNEQSIEEIEHYVKELVNKHVSELGAGLRVTNVQKVGDDFHPTFGATCRAYAYLIDLQNDDSTEQPRITRDTVTKLDGMLRALESQTLDYVAFSYGKVKTQTTNCTLLYARASLVECAVSKKEAICIELIGDRFLRRMVRILVATALREACADTAREDSLQQVIATRDRTICAPAAPPGGLIFVAAGYD